MLSQYLTKMCVVIVLNMAYIIPTNSQELDSISIVTAEYPPGIDSQRKDNGYISRMVSDAFALSDIKVKYKFMPWARAYHSTREGNALVVMYYAKTKEREKDFLFSDPLFEEKWFIFHLKKTPLDWEQLSDLSDYKIGAIETYTYSEEFYQLHDQGKLKVHWVSRDEQNWHMLLAQRIDLTISPAIGWAQLSRIYSAATIENISTHPKPFKQHVTYLLFSKKHPDAEYYRDQFNKGFAKLKQLRSLSYYMPYSDGVAWPEIVNDR